MEFPPLVSPETGLKWTSGIAEGDTPKKRASRQFGISLSMLHGCLLQHGCVHI